MKLRLVLSNQVYYEFGSPNPGKTILAGTSFASSEAIKLGSLYLSPTLVFDGY